MVQMQSMGLKAPIDSEALLRLSAVSQIRQIQWLRRNYAVACENGRLEDVLSGLSARAKSSRRGKGGSTPGATVGQVQEALNELLGNDAPDKGKGGNEDIGTGALVDPVVHLAYHIGQDLMAAGHSKLAAKVTARSRMAYWIGCNRATPTGAACACWWTATGQPTFFPTTWKGSVSSVPTNQPVAAAATHPNIPEP